MHPDNHEQTAPRHSQYSLYFSPPPPPPISMVMVPMLYPVAWDPRVAPCPVPVVPQVAANRGRMEPYVGLLPSPQPHAAAAMPSSDPIYKEFADVGCTYVSYEQLRRRTPPPSATRSPAEASTDIKFFVGQLPFGADFDFFQRLVALVAPWQTVRSALGDAVAPKFNSSKQRVMHSGTLFVMVPAGTEARFLDALTERIVFDAEGVWLVDGPEQRAFVSKYLRQHQNYIKRALHLPYNFLNVEPAKRQQHFSQQDAAEEDTFGSTLTK